MEKLTILGSSHAIPTPDQDTTHLLVETSKRMILIDTGINPVARLKKLGISLSAVTDILLTHAHADHMGSLPQLIMDMWLEKRSNPLIIYGLEYTLDRAKKLLEIFDWQKWQKMFPVEFKTISDTSESTLIDEEQLRMISLPVKHVIPNVGVRMEFPGHRYTAAYSCDTEPCDAVLRLAKQADVLIQETAGNARGHTSAAQAGEMAAEAGVKRLILIHYDPTIDGEKMIREAASSFNGRIELAKDGMMICGTTNP